MPEETLKDYSFLFKEVKFPAELKTLNIIPEDDIFEHDNDSTCPCNPQLNYKCPHTQREIWVHNCLKETTN